MSKSTTSSRLSESDTVSNLYRIEYKIKCKQDGILWQLLLELILVRA